MAYANTFNTATPLGSESPTQGDDRIREAKASIQERLAYDHYFPTNSGTGDTLAGTHLQVTFKATISTPTPLSGQGILYTKIAGGEEELHYIYEGGGEKQLTAGGQLNIEPADLAVNTLIDDTTIGLNGSNLLYVKNDGIGGNQIADDAIDSEHIADGAIDKVHLADDADTVKAFGSFDGTGSGSLSVSGGIEVTSVTKTATGTYDVVITDVGSTLYCVQVTANEAVSGEAKQRFAWVSNLTSNSFTIYVSDYSGSLSLEDSPLINFIVLKPS